MSRRSIIILFGCITALLYGQILTHEFVSFDDGILIYDNHAIQTLTPQSIWWVFTHFDPELYVPLTSISYQLNHLIGGLNPFIYFLTNILLHYANALLVVGFIWLLSRNKWISVITGLLFLIHPLNTEAIAWASSRKDVLSTFFFLLSICAYVQYQESGLLKKWRQSLLAFFLALLSKVSIILLPVVLLALDYEKEKKISKESVIEKWPFFALSAVFGIIGMFGKSHVVEMSGGPVHTILMAAKSTVFYLQSLFVPLNLSIIYPYRDPIVLWNPDFFIPIILLIAIATVIVKYHNRVPHLLFSAVFFGALLAPSFPSFMKRSHAYFASDRYAYVPSIAFFFILATVIWMWWQRTKEQFRKAGIYVGSVLLAGLCILTFLQVRVWQNTQTLFAHSIKLYPNSYISQNKIGAHFLDEGKMEEAFEHLERSIELQDNERARLNLGLAYMKLNRTELALEQFEASLNVNPFFYQSLINVGFIYTEKGRNMKAIEYFERAVEANEHDITGFINLAVLYIETGKTEEARELLPDLMRLGRGEEEVKIIADYLE